jgi:hypothetical protein
MPNWCENELTITGPDVQKVLEAIRSESDEDARVLDFNQILPYPKHFRELDERSLQYQEQYLAVDRDDPERQARLDALAAEYSVEPGTPWLKDGFNSGGYEWCCEVWGTKWNAVRALLSLQKDGSVRIDFDTAWSPPIPVIEKLSAIFPEHQFTLEYFEGGCGFCGQARWENGNEQYHNQGDYDGPRGG